MFVYVFNTMISKPIAYLSDKTWRKQFWKKGGILRLSANLAFCISRIKCMQNKNRLKIGLLAFQMIALLKVYKTYGANLSGISDLRRCSNFEVEKQLQFESGKYVNGSHPVASPYRPFKINRRERQHNRLSRIKSSFDLDWQFTQKLKFSDFNDSYLNWFWSAKFEHRLRSLMPARFAP